MRRDAYNIAALAALGLAPLLWFSGDYSAVGGYDFATSLKPLDDLRRSVYLWDERLYAGAPNVLSTGTMPYFLLQYLFEKAAGSLYKGQAAFFTLLFMLPGLSMYWFLRRLFPDEKGSAGIAFWGALFSMFNTFVVVKWNRGELIALFSYATLPLYLALVDRGLKGPLTFWFMLAYLTSLFFYPVALGHPADFVIATTLIAAYAMFTIFSANTADTSERLKKALVLFLAALGTGLWWTLPVSGVAGGGGTGASFAANELELVNYYSSWATLLNLMKMWFFSMYATGVEFSTQFYRPGTLLFPIIGFSALFFKRNTAVLFFSAAALAGLWLSKGTSPPFPGLYEWMYRHIPFFFIFRAPTRYFPLLYTVSLSVLIGFSFGKASLYFRERFPGRAVKVIPAVAAASLIFFHSWPLFKRDVLFRAAEGDRLYPSVFLKIPSYYGDLNGWFASKEGYFRVHSLHSESYMNYDWGYSSTDIATKLLEVPQTVKFSQELVFGGSGFHQILDEFGERFWAWEFARPDRLLGFLSVRYLTVVNDVMRRYLPDTNFYEVAASAVSAQPGFALAADIGKARVYENRLSRSHIYVAGPALAVFGPPRGLVTLSGAEMADKRDFIFFEDLYGGPISRIKGAVDGVVFVESSFSDILLDTLDKRWLVRGGEFIAEEDGLYSVWIKTDGKEVEGLETEIDGRTLKDKDALPGGLRWVSAGTAFLEEGAHIFKAVGDGVEKAAVVPAHALDSAEKRLVDFFDTNTLPVTYVFDGEGAVRLYSAKNLKARAVPALTSEKRRVAGLSESYEGSDSLWVTGEETEIEKDRDGVSFKGKAVRAIRRLNSIDLEEFPFARIYGDSGGELKLSIGVDFDNDGWADEEITPKMSPFGGYYDSADIAKALKDEFGFPGKPFYKALWASVSVEGEKGASELRIKGIEFFHYVPEFVNIKETQRVEIDIEGAGRGFKTARPAKDGSLFAVSEMAGPERTHLLPDVSSERSSPVKYEARIRRGKEFRPFWLVFNESFHEGWKARVNGEGLGVHAEINGYANGWWVDKDHGESFTVELYFAPQRRLDYGAAASAGLAIVALAGTALFRRKK